MDSRLVGNVVSLAAAVKNSSDLHTAKKLSQFFALQMIIDI